MVRSRDTVEPRYRWDLSQLYDDVAAWEEDLERARGLIDDLSGSTVETGEDLLALLHVQDDLFAAVERLATYANLRVSEDTTDQEAQALKQRARSLASRASAAASFIDPLIQEIGEDRIAEMLDAEQELERYRHYLDDVLRLQPHTLPGEQEKLLSRLAEVLYGTGETYSMLTDADFPFPEVETPDGEVVEVTQNRFPSLLQHRDRAFRETVYERFYDAYEAFRHTITAAYTNSVRTNVVLARIRDHKSAREHALFGSNIPVTVYDTLLETVQNRLSLLHRHLALKKDALDLDEVRMWDLYTPLVDEPAEVPYGEAVEHVLAAVRPLGEDYLDRMQALLDGRRIDVYETAGKRSGGFSSGAYPGPSYILMNYQADVPSMYTLAHELGHAMHSDLTNDSQPYVYSHYPIFSAEVASTVNESLLTHHLLEHGDERLQRQALNHVLEEVRTTVYRQTLFAAFEHEVHGRVENDEPLTVDILDDTYRGLKETFYGPAVVDDRAAWEWMRIPHFFSAFYVYQYATGMSAALALSEKIRADGPDDYLAFLRSGSSDYPLPLLQAAGVDLTTPKPVTAALDVYEAYLDRMADLLSSDTAF